VVEITYGYFPGGGYDPRRFKPDVEVCTDAEVQAHRAACEAWDRGERALRFEVTGRVSPDGVKACGSAYGMGTFEIELGEGALPPGGEEILIFEAAAPEAAAV